MPEKNVFKIPIMVFDQFVQVLKQNSGKRHKQHGSSKQPCDPKRKALRPTQHPVPFCLPPGHCQSPTVALEVRNSPLQAGLPDPRSPVIGTLWEQCCIQSTAVCCPVGV